MVNFRFEIPSLGFSDYAMATKSRKTRAKLHIPAEI